MSKIHLTYLVEQKLQWKLWHKDFCCARNVYGIRKKIKKHFSYSLLNTIAQSSTLTAKGGIYTIPMLEHGEGSGTPLQYSCLENPMDGGACRLPSMESLRVGHNWATSLSCIGEGNGNPLQCSCLENPRDWGAWWAAVYGVAESDTT